LICLVAWVLAIVLPLVRFAAVWVFMLVSSAPLRSRPGTRCWAGPAGRGWPWTG
jgi:hypothetical protein